MTRKAIDVGCGTQTFLKEFLHNYLPAWDNQQLEITRMDGDPNTKPDIVHNLLTPIPKKYKGKFDFAYMAHVLEHIPWRDTVSVAKEVVGLVKPGGYCLINVPSLEWACKEVIRGRFHIGVLMTIYGGQDDEWLFHKSGFTKAVLELLARRIKMSVVSLRETNAITVANNAKFSTAQLELFMRKET